MEHTHIPASGRGGGVCCWSLFSTAAGDYDSPHMHVGVVFVLLAVVGRGRRRRRLVGVALAGGHVFVRGEAGEAVVRQSLVHGEAVGCGRLRRPCAELTTALPP